MQKMIHFIRGSVTLAVEGAFPERLLNLCAQRRVLFWSVEWQSPTEFRFRVMRHDLTLVKKLAERVQCDLTEGNQTGVPFFLARFRRRYAFLVGLFLSVITVCTLSGFVLSVDVSGNETVPTAQILTELRRLGLYPGVYGPGMDTAQTTQEALLAMPELSFMAINLHGTRAEIIVRESVEPPEVIEEVGRYDVVASATGIIDRMEVLSGKALVSEGDTVIEGDTIISGLVPVEAPEFSELELGEYTVHAAGNVWARTWRAVTAIMPLEAQGKDYSGREKIRFSMTVLGRRINFYGKAGISFARYDKIRETKTPELSDGMTLPAVLTVETCREYTPVTFTVNEEEAKKLLEQRLLDELSALVGETGEVVSVCYGAETEGGFLTVCAQAECYEQIGIEVPMDQG